MLCEIDAEAVQKSRISGKCFWGKKGAVKRNPGTNPDMKRVRIWFPGFFVSRGMLCIADGSAVKAVCMA